MAEPAASRNRARRKPGAKPVRGGNGGAGPRAVDGKVPVHDLDAEAAVVERVLAHPPELAKIPQLQPEHFFDEANQIVFRAVRELEAKGSVPDTVAVVGLLRARGEYQRISGRNYFDRLAETPASVQIEQHAKRVQELALQRQAVAKAHEIAATGYQPQEDVGAWLSERVEGLSALTFAPEPPPGAIDGTWGQLPVDWLSTMPPRRRWLLRHPTRNWHECLEGQGDGMLERGRVGVFSADSGKGKSMMLCEMGIDIVLGRPWLGHFEVDPSARGRRVLLGLAEEDRDECRRRLYRLADVLCLSDEEKRLVAERLIALPLAGHDVSLVRVGRDGRLHITGELEALRKHLIDEGGEEGWALVVLDPLSRFGPDVEGDNAIATRFITVAETLCRVPGEPALLFAHHCSKADEQAGKGGIRGVSGLKAAFRWAAELRPGPDGTVHFQQMKSNYSVPMPEALELVRGDYGVLRALTPAEREQRKRRADAKADEQVADNIAAVVDVLQAEGQASSIDQIVALAKLGSKPGRIAVRTAIARGLILREGTQREPVFRASPGESSIGGQDSASEQGGVDR